MPIIRQKKHRAKTGTGSQPSRKIGVHPQTPSHFYEVTITATIIQNRFRIDLLLTKGPQGAVYRGTDLQADGAGSVAMKKVAGLRSRGGAAVVSKEWAALKVLAGIPEIVLPRAIVEDESDDATWMITNWIDGCNPLEKAPFGEAALVAMACRGFYILQSIHSARVLHRDVKPSNLILDETGNLNWIDFGVAFSAGAATGETRAGTLQYMDPRILRGQGADALSDLFGFVTTLLHCYRGSELWPARDPLNLYHFLKAYLRDSRRELVAGLSPPIAGSFLKALYPWVDDDFRQPTATAAQIIEQCLGACAAYTDCHGGCHGLDLELDANGNRTGAKQAVLTYAQRRLQDGWSQGHMKDTDAEQSRMIAVAGSCRRDESKSPQERARWLAYEEHRRFEAEKESDCVSTA